MPYQTFFNLPEVKRQRLMDAVWQEFTTVSYNEASINKIIQAAGISRGSFYQYFAGKQDLFSYLLTTVYTAGKQMFTAQLMAHSNNLFSAILGMYDMILWRKSKGRFTDEQRKIHCLIRLNFDMDLTQFLTYMDTDSMARSIREVLRQSGYMVENLEECYALLNMLAAVAISGLADTMRHPSNEQRNRRYLEHQLLIIRRGLATYQSE